MIEYRRCIIILILVAFIICDIFHYDILDHRIQSLSRSGSSFLIAAQETAYDTETDIDKTVSDDTELDEVEQQAGGYESEDDGTATSATSTDRKGTREHKTLEEELFGDVLYQQRREEEVNAEGKKEQVMSIYAVPTATALKNKKYLALYFSASWCGPCRQFTPMLVKFYLSVLKKLGGDSLEVVWISQDRRQEDFLAYYQTMPWLAVPIEQIQAVNTRLAPRYQLKGIPHLVFLEVGQATAERRAEGRILSLEGRKKVMEDPSALAFPWLSPLQRVVTMTRSAGRLGIFTARSTSRLLHGLLSLLSRGTKQLGLQEVMRGLLASMVPHQMLERVREKVLSVVPPMVLQLLRLQE